MQQQLEDIPFDQVVDTNGDSYAQFRKKLQPRYGKVAADIAKGYLAMAITIVALLFLDRRYPAAWWTWMLPGALLIGYIAAYIALFIHEAGHFNIHPNKKTNDRLATIFLCLPFGLSLTSYRKIHWQHHLHLGTPKDAEVSYFHALTRLFLLETLTGIHVLRTMTRKSGNEVLTRQQKKESRVLLLAGALFHILILAAFFLSGHWAIAVTWILGFGIGFPFFATIRQLLEHRDELAQRTIDYYKESHGKVSRIFVHHFFNSSFGAAGFTRHMIHHWDPQVSYTRLRDIEFFLLRSERTAPILKNARTHYRTVFKKLLAAR